MEQVALIRFATCEGFAGEPITYVKKVKFFRSKKAAQKYNYAIWQKIGRPIYYGIVLPYIMVTRGTEDFKQFAINKKIIGPGPDEIE